MHTRVGSKNFIWIPHETPSLSMDGRKESLGPSLKVNGSNLELGSKVDHMKYGKTKHGPLFLGPSSFVFGESCKSHAYSAPVSLVSSFKPVSWPLRPLFFSVRSGMGMVSNNPRLGL